LIWDFEYQFKKIIKINLRHCVTMAAEFIFYAILCVVFVGYVVVMHVIKRNETNTRS
jgi:hypothetical protein